MLTMDRVELRETDIAQQWIEQFDAADRMIASLLLDSLILIDTTELNRGIRDVVFAGLRDQCRPVALYAIREAPRILPPHERREPHMLKYAEPYFDPDDDTARPDAVGRGGGVGSEGDIAHLIRDLTRELGPSRALDHPSIHAMRSTKCPRIILVDDIIGSGKRSRSFVEWFCDHKTIRSWTSLHYTHIVVVAYAAVDRLSKRLRSHRFVSSTLSDRSVQQGRRFWTDDQRQAIKTLCRDYAPNTSRPGLSLGFGEALTCMVFEHHCPNTAPAILWAERKITWKALFKKRPGLGTLAWPVSINQTQRDSTFLASIRQEKLSLQDWQNHFSGPGRLRILVVATVAKKLHRPQILSECLEISVAKATTLLQECRELGWIDAVPRVTADGIRALDYARKCGILKEDVIELKEGFYFPRSLRMARGSV